MKNKANHELADLAEPRICLVAHDPGVQGAERAMLDMAIFLRDAGWATTVLLPRGAGGLKELVEASGLESKVLPYKYWIGPGTLCGRLFRIVTNLLVLPWLVFYFRKSCFDVVYTHSIAVGAPAVAARIIGCPHLWHLHEFGIFEHDERRMQFDFGNALTLRIVRWTNSTIVAVAEVIRDAYKQHLPGMDIRVIYQPVPFNPELDPRDREAIEKIRATTGPKIIYVGAVTETKRQEDAIRGMADILKKHPQARLFLAGRVDEKYGAQMKTIARDLEIEHAVEYLGYLNDAPAVIGLCDASVNCRLTEASPRVLIESMMARVVVIAAAAGGNVEILTPETGRLYQPKDSIDFANQINWAIENPEPVAQIVDAAEQKAIEDRAVSVYTDRYVDLIEDAISSAMSKRSASTRQREKT